MHTLNCEHLPCPEPVVRSRDLLTKVQPNDALIIVDNAAALENVSRFWSRHGYQVHSEQDDVLWRITVTKEARAASLADDAGVSGVRAESAPRKTVILLTSATIGSGDDELGARLMENFLLTLPELDEELWSVILLNGGVKLAATPGKALEGLRALEKAGVSVLVCGACLTFYGLMESKEVGETTNMLDVVTRLGLADKVIRP